MSGGFFAFDRDFIDKYFDCDFEQAIVTNATGITVARRGMGGADHHGRVDELVTAPPPV